MLQIETIAFVYGFVIFRIFFIFPLFSLIYFCFMVIFFLFILRIVVSESHTSSRVIRIYKDILFIAKVCTTLYNENILISMILRYLTWI